MALLSILTRSAPQISYAGTWITFDAVFRDTFEASVDYTQYPIEVGANATDFGIIRPITYTIEAGVSNNPLQVGLTESAGGFLSNFFDSGIVSQVAGLSAGFLAGSDATRAGATLDLLLALMYARQPFDVNTGEKNLSNMVITNVSRTKEPENEGALLFTAQLQELPLLATVLSNEEPDSNILPNDDPAKTQASANKQRGEILGLEFDTTNIFSELFGVTS